MPPNRDREFRFWESVTYRLLAICLLGFAMILLFRGCVIPSIKDEMRQDRQKALETDSAR